MPLKARGRWQKGQIGGAAAGPQTPHPAPAANGDEGRSSYAGSFCRGEGLDNSLLKGQNQGQQHRPPLQELEKILPQGLADLDLDL